MKVRGTADPSASLGMTKERVVVIWKAVARPKAMKNVFGQKPPSIERSPSPLSSRAKPRDLQFCGPFLDMFLAEGEDLRFSFGM
jgi:hypothetical protein